MEVGLDPLLPTYSGGLGVLAADTLRAAADMGLPMVGVTLVHRKGYFRQHLDASGNQTESPMVWSPEQHLEPMRAVATVRIAGRPVHVRAWRYIVRGHSGHDVPVYFLDTSVPENSPEDQALTDSLYGGDERYRLAQEIVLGFGGVAVLRALGHTVGTYHMNEGHAALLALALMEEQTAGRGLGAATETDHEAVRGRCVFTTHTPVAAGHDKFSPDLVRSLLGDEWTAFLQETLSPAGVLNMTYLALHFSRYINGVAMRHGEISHDMFPTFPINSITNGVHAATWTAGPFRRLFDQHIPEWRWDNDYLRYAVGIPLAQIRQCHAEAKAPLFAEVEQRTGIRLDPSVLTVGFARRTTAYKRGDMLFSDLTRLREVVRRAGRLQVLYAGKAHPRDEGGKAVIRRVFEAASALQDTLRVLYLEEYDLTLAGLLVAGVDLWLNTPQKPLEASGSSGMKAALNGVPSLSVLDGWWIEGHVEGVTGWAIGDASSLPADPAAEASALYAKLEQVILPMFYGRPDEFAAVGRSAIALNGSFFNAQRMLGQYLRNAYLQSDTF